LICHVPVISLRGLDVKPNTRTAFKTKKLASAKGLPYGTTLYFFPFRHVLDHHKFSEPTSASKISKTIGNQHYCSCFLGHLDCGMSFSPSSPKKRTSMHGLAIHNKMQGLSKVNLKFYRVCTCMSVLQSSKMFSPLSLSLSNSNLQQWFQTEA